jgi:hypothetical protein
MKNPNSTNSQDSFLPLYLIQLNQRRAIKPRRKGKFESVMKIPGKVISEAFSGIISLIDSALWAFTGIPTWIIIPLLAFLIVFGPALVVELFPL